MVAARSGQGRSCWPLFSWHENGHAHAEVQAAVSPHGSMALRHVQQAVGRRGEGRVALCGVALNHDDKPTISGMCRASLGYDGMGVCTDCLKIRFCIHIPVVWKEEQHNGGRSDP